MSIREKTLNLRFTTIVSALLAGGALSTAQAAVPASGQSRVIRATLTDLGVAPANTVKTIALSLPLRNKDALTAFVASTVDPKSANFRKFITPAQFNATYGATPDSIAQVSAYLAANGIAVSRVSSNGLLVIAKATNAQLTSLFGTAIHTYSDGSRTFERPVGTAVLPQGLVGLAQAVTGLSTQPLAHSYRKTPPRAGALAQEPDVAVRPLAGAHVLATNTPGQLTTADMLNNYNGAPLGARGLDGTGITLGIMTFAGFSQSDAYGYWNAIGQAVLPNRITEINVADNVATPTDDDYEETSLDVEQSGGVAPQARIIVYEAANTDVGAIELYDQAVSENKCDTLSVSWGLAEVYEDNATLAAYDSIFLEAAALGIPIAASAGDQGAYDINGNDPYPAFTPILTVDFPASHPLVLAAGGTTLAGTMVFKHATLTVPAERPWAWDYMRAYYLQYYNQATYYGDAWPVGGGGGVSVDYGVPTYQAGIAGLKSSSAGQSMFGPEFYDPTTGSSFGPLVDYIDMPANVAGRNVPDVSLDADPYTGYLIAYGGSLYAEWGGTSFVAPQLNGITALITQQAGGRLGQLHPQLYGAFRTYGYGAGSPFKAVGTGTNEFYTSTNGYNPAVGLGVLNIDNLAKVLAPSKPN
jgi:kumamolisin